MENIRQGRYNFGFQAIWSVLMSKVHHMQVKSLWYSMITYLFLASTRGKTFCSLPYNLPAWPNQLNSN